MCLSDSVWVWVTGSPLMHVSTNKFHEAWKRMFPYVHSSTIALTIFPLDLPQWSFMHRGVSPNIGMLSRDMNSLVSCLLHIGNVAFCVYDTLLHEKALLVRVEECICVLSTHSLIYFIGLRCCGGFIISSSKNHYASLLQKYLLLVRSTPKYMIIFPMIKGTPNWTGMIRGATFHPVVYSSLIPSF